MCRPISQRVFARLKFAPTGNGSMVTLLSEFRPGAGERRAGRSVVPWRPRGSRAGVAPAMVAPCTDAEQALARDTKHPRFAAGVYTRVVGRARGDSNPRSRP